ncbi:MAG: hypothetical protein LBS60_02245 [Deltaproteobacteria bacterium]|nr:hypothetical protein [Deltaproteobacteria bacterium]
MTLLTHLLRRSLVRRGGQTLFRSGAGWTTVKGPDGFLGPPPWGQVAQEPVGLKTRARAP